MKKLYTLVILIILVTSGCEDEECGACFTPPESFYFEIIDKETKENLFTNGTYDPEDLQVTDDLNNGEQRDFLFVTDNDLNIIEIAGWGTEIANLNVTIEDNTIFKFYIDAETRSQNCCTFTKINETQIKEADFSYNSETGIYTILIER